MQWAAARVVEQLLGLCGGAAFPEQVLIVEPPVPGLFSLALAGQGSSCGFPGCRCFMGILGGIPEIGSSEIGGHEE